MQIKSNSSDHTPPLLVGDGAAVLPVSRCIVMVTSFVSPRPCVLRPGSAGYGHREQPARHDRETPLQHHVRLSVCLYLCVSLYSFIMRRGILLLTYFECFFF